MNKENNMNIAIDILRVKCKNARNSLIKTINIIDEVEEMAI